MKTVFVCGNNVISIKKICWYLLIVIILSIGVVCPTKADSTQINLTISDRGSAFSLIRQTVSNFFGININNMQPYQQTMSPDQMIPLLYLAGESHSTPHQIWLKHQGKGWGALAHDLGLPSKFHDKFMSRRHHQKYRAQISIDDYDYEEIMTVKFLNDYYGVAPDVIYSWHQRGLSYEDLFLGFNLSARLYKQPREIFGWRISRRDWRFIASHYRLPYSVLLEPVQPLRKLVITISSLF